MDDNLLKRISIGLMCVSFLFLLVALLLPRFGISGDTFSLLWNISFWSGLFIVFVRVSLAYRRNHLQ